MHGNARGARVPLDHARGIFGQTIEIVPSQQLVVVINGTFPKALDEEHGPAIRAPILAPSRQLVSERALRTN
ncbi:MAG: hypothetical protein ABW252_04775 [Polyangiales bacterium]